MASSRVHTTAVTSSRLHTAAVTRERSTGVVAAVRQLVIGLTALAALLATVTLTAAGGFGASAETQGAFPEPAPAPWVVGTGPTDATLAADDLEQLIVP